MNGAPVSVSGNFQAFTIVGIQAKPSLKIAKTIAIIGSLVMLQRIKASKEKVPQT